MWMMAFFFVFFFSVWVSMHVYVAWRFGRTLNAKGRRVAWGLLGLHLVVSLVGMGMRNFPQFEPFYSIAKMGYYTFMGGFLLLFSLLVMKDLIWWVGDRLRGRGAVAEEATDRERREFLINGLNFGVLAAATGGTALGYYEARRMPDLVRVNVPMERLPSSLEGLRIAQISDIHVGPTVRKSMVERIVAEVNRLSPDLVVITGDLIEGDIDHIWEDVSPVFGLKSRHGTYYCTGNHEYYWDGPGWCGKLAEEGIEVLNNEHRLIEHNGGRLLVAGCTDHSAHRFVAEHRSDPKKAKEGAPVHDLSLLLAHQPVSIHEASEAGFDLQLSGHTHGGQFFPGPLVINFFHPFAVGLHRLKKTWIYVSRGTGYWGPPMRLKAPSEITLITLTKGKEEDALVEREPIRGYS